MEFAFAPSLGSPDEEIICYRVTLVSEGGRDVVKECSLEVSKHNAAFRFDKDGTLESVVVDGKATNQEGQVYVARRENGKLIPQLLDFDLPESSPWIVRAAPLILESLSR